ncbi:hypothetical protein PG985_002314 [Apiospora marii]|uniref:Uncharacterized protein n=1 Tax=Apiospora marii TaxID=335849 RepID=A0ABR1RTP7_9PEZI
MHGHCHYLSCRFYLRLDGGLEPLTGRVRKSTYHITAAGFIELTGTTATTLISPGSQDISSTEEQKKPPYKRQIRVHIAECQRGDAMAPIRPTVSGQEYHAQPLSQV